MHIKHDDDLQAFLGTAEDIIKVFDEDILLKSDIENVMDQFDENKNLRRAKFV